MSRSGSRSTRQALERGAPVTRLPRFHTLRIPPRQVHAKLEVLGFSHAQQVDMFKLFAAVLTLGNVEFAEKGEGSEISNMEVIKKVATARLAHPQQARDPRDVQGAGRRRRQEVEGEGDRRAEVGDTHRSTRHAMARRGAPHGQRAEC